ncbi:MAG: hypothetical protein NT018_09755 [Armatimonadetes bacterium]|nr:hypothetical protein [Armatimonadota bacterium]
MADSFDVDASGTDVMYVLEALARQSRANIVISPDVKGQVNIHIKGQPLQLILDNLATALDFAWKKEGSTYLIMPKLKAEPPVVEAKTEVDEVLVWDCKHIRPTDLVLMVKELFSSIKVSEGPGVITPSLGGSAGLAGVAGGDATGGSASTTGVQVSGASGQAKPGASKLILMGSGTDLAKVKDILTKLDTPRKQVSIEVIITEVGSTGSKELGVDWTWSDYAIKDTVASGIGFGKFNKGSISVTGAVSALVKDGLANLLAQPNISVLDGESADILIGDRILYPKLIGYNQVGSPIYDKSEEKVGICLQIAPRIAADDQVILTLYPQVSLVTGYLKTQAGDYPQISTREVRTTVSVKSGTTLAIGGLLRNNEIASMSKIPLLGDLPFFGKLFRHSKKTSERTEIVILLTPKIIPDVGEQISPTISEGTTISEIIGTGEVK